MDAMMTEERFAALAQAHGGQMRRWPKSAKAQAAAFAEAFPRVAERLLASQRGLDEALDASPTPAPGAALRRRIVAGAPAAARAGRAGGRAWRWLTGVGVGVALASAGAAGVIVGLTETPPGVVRAIWGVQGGGPTDEVSALLAPARRPDDA
ncbi:MAG TPA: hypothetical protein VMU93_11155 [Caulobacteraceae bacterium]|nr:hypothetical protein [Caulobacteraceae bacterium]